MKEVRTKKSVEVLFSPLANISIPCDVALSILLENNLPPPPFGKPWFKKRGIILCIIFSVNLNCRGTFAKSF